MPQTTIMRWLALAVVLLAPLYAQVVTNLGSIDWGNPAGWSTGHIPGGSETPQISTGTVLGAFSVQSIHLFSGALGGGGKLTLTNVGSR